MNLLRDTQNYLRNILGKSIRRKIVVIESDDWGSIRMPSFDVFQKLVKKGYGVTNDPFMKYDSLASETDLSFLLETLASVKDKNGSCAKLTMNTILTNPDFQRIEASNFISYYYELFTETLSKYPEHNNSFSLWKEGIERGLLKPQFHGKEHLNVAQWMKALQENDPLVLEAFQNRMISISSEKSKMRFAFMEELDYFSEIEKNAKPQVIEDGLKLFEQVFGFKSKSFIGCCFIWDRNCEQTLAEGGISLIQGVIRQNQPQLNKRNFKPVLHYMGQRNDLGQHYLIRNVSFEPSVMGLDIIDDCLKEVQIAFALNKPAIISMHRLNFIGYINPVNRDNNLKALLQMLKAVTRRWPDVEFMFSDDLAEFYF